MKRLSAIILVLMLAALPLRGMAAVIADLCGPQQGAAAQQSHECCDGAEAQAAGSHHGNQQNSADGSCSHCAACSVGTPVLSEFKQALPEMIPATHAIPFSDRRVQGFVPEILDRPPLPL
jgi:hypothetical protein